MHFQTLPLLLPLLSLPLTTSHPTLSPRSDAPATLVITTYPAYNCDGSIHPSAQNGMRYDVPAIRTISSYTLSRDLIAGEQLDFSYPGPDEDGNKSGDPCSQFLETSNPDSNGNLLKEGICYGLVGMNATAEVSFF